MTIPPSSDDSELRETCGNCRHISRCLNLGYTDSPERDHCDFSPSKFQRKNASILGDKSGAG